MPSAGISLASAVFKKRAGGDTALGDIKMLYLSYV
jgi:hypothetical protein